MAKYSYSTSVGEKDASAVGIALPISTKQAIEICRTIRGKRLERAKAILSDALSEKVAIPFRIFTNGLGHKRGRMASGRFPKKACSEILKIINSAQANAQFKGLSSPDLIIRHISSQKSSSTWKYGRRRAQAKRTTIEVVLTEIAGTKKQDEKKAPQKKEAAAEAPSKKEKPAAKPKQEKAKEEKAGQ